MAKRRAADEALSLGDLMTEALRARLAPRPASTGRPFSMVIDGEGGPRPGVDITSNAAVRDLMDEG